MTNTYILIGIFIMAGVTYLIRCTPMILFRKKITNRFIKSFLHYVPYTVLTAMTFPAVFTCTGSIVGSSLGCVVALILAYFNKGLLTVAISASLVAFIVKFIGF